MGIIKEPLDVDFFVESRPYTKKEQKLVTEFIRASKKKSAKQQIKKPKSTNPPTPKKRTSKS